MSRKSNITKKGSAQGYHQTFKMDGSPQLGISLEAIPKGGKGRVALEAFVTDFDGELFFSYLEGISSIFLIGWSASGYRHSQIDNFLILIDKESNVDLYINFPVIASIRAKKELKKGTPVIKDDIAELRDFQFPNINFEDGSGVIYFFSVGWRRGLYFNFTPLHSVNQKTNRKYSELFSNFYSYLLFPEVYRKNTEQMKELWAEGWFPFIRLLGNNFLTLNSAYQSKIGIIDAVNQIVDSFDEDLLKGIMKGWFEKPEYQKHQRVIETGIERYISGDYISAINNLYPRIEGIMRFLYFGEKKQGTTRQLIEKLKVVAESKTVPNSLLLPQDFCEYLKEVFFSKFDLETGEVNLSRNSVAHGVVEEGRFDKVAAFQAIMILDQISFYL